MEKQIPAAKKRIIRIAYILVIPLVGPLPNLYIVADGMGGHRAGDFASKYGN